MDYLEQLTIFFSAHLVTILAVLVLVPTVIFLTYSTFRTVRTGSSKLESAKIEAKIDESGVSSGTTVQVKNSYLDSLLKLINPVVLLLMLGFVIGLLIYWRPLRSGLSPAPSEPPSASSEPPSAPSEPPSVPTKPSSAPKLPSVDSVSSVESPYQHFEPALFMPFCDEIIFPEDFFLRPEDFLLEEQKQSIGAAFEEVGTFFKKVVVGLFCVPFWVPYYFFEMLFWAPYCTFEEYWNMFFVEVSEVIKSSIVDVYESIKSTIMFFIEVGRAMKSPFSGNEVTPEQRAVAMGSLGI